MTEDDRAAVERQLDNRYQIIRTLGAGAFGAVYLARERDLHRLVAIKVLRHDRAWSDDERERLLREARTIANLSHPSVVPLLAFGESDGMVYMVMPYVSGQTLADRLTHDEPFDADEVRRILLELADALAYVHGEGVLHRDLKPENVLLERAGAVDDHMPPRVRLIDFGVAAFPMRDPGVNASRETWGTPNFMAPEQMFGEPELDPRCEIYSLGVLGYLLLGGRLPFDTATPTERLAQQRKGPAVPLSVCAPDAPADLVRAIERCLAYEPGQRWRRARDIRDTLIAGTGAGNAFTPLTFVRQLLRPNPAAVERFAARRRRRQQPRMPLAGRIAEAVSGFDADVRFALRAIRKAPAFSAAIIAILAIGLGATAVVLSAVEAFVLRPVPVADPKALVVIQEQRQGPNQSTNFGASAFRYDRYLSYRDATAGVFTNIAAQTHASFSIRIGNEARSAGGLVTSGSYFDVLGVRPAIGRFYESQIDEPGGAQSVAVLSYDFWQGTLNADSSVIGTTIHVDSRPMTVVAVAPKGFKGAIGAVFPLDVWVPAPAYATATIRDRDAPGAQPAQWMNIFGRLRPGVTVLGASEALNAIAPRVPTEDPGTRILEARAEPLRTLPAFMQDSVERFLTMLFALALLVLVISAANAAGMLLARATARTREIATRMAVGAGRARLLRQLMVESVVLCAAAGVAGALVASWLSRFLVHYRPFGIPVSIEFGVNGSVLAIVGVIVLGTALVAGIFPAVRATAIDLAGALKAGGAQGASESRSRLRSAFVVAQIASSVVLLATAGLFIRSFQRSLDIDPGFRAEGVIAADVSLGAHGYDSEAAGQFHRRLLEGLRGRTEIAVAALAHAAPLSGAAQTERVTRAGRPDDRFRAQWAFADSGLIELLETPLVAGRFFTGQDRRASAPVAIINVTLAHSMWPDDPPSSIVGRRLASLGRELEVVGIIGNGRYASLHEAPKGFGYVPFTQFETSRLLYIRARTTTEAAMQAATEELAKLDPHVALERPRLLAQDVERFLLQPRLGARLIAAFGLVGVVLAMTGLYAVLAFGVAQRMREFGVRLALGARGADISRMVLRQGFALVGVGLVIGMAGAIAAGRVVAGFLYGIGAVDPATLVAVPLLLVLVAVVASLVPARRGAAADPMTSLRAE